MTRRVAIFSGSRAELALQLPVLNACERDPRIEPLLVLGGAHTQSDVHPDDLRDVPVAGRVFELPNEGRVGTPQAIATGILSASGVFAELDPDIVLVYGDRFESFAALVAATQQRIPVAHVEGGDYTAGGCLDDAIRHAMTKLAHLHFTTNTQATERVLRMGEEPWRVHTVGLPSLDAAAQGDYATPEELQRALGLSLEPEHPIALFCMHPVPGTDPRDEANAAIAALGMLAMDGWQIVALHPNNDAGGRQMLDYLRTVASTSERMQLHQNLGRHRFHGMLSLLGQGYGCMIGNSSAGIKEAPFFGCPVVNVGTRQKGRLRAGNVIDVESKPHAIYAAAKRLERIRMDTRSPYGAGNACAQIVEVLATVELGETLLRKGMTY